MRVMAVVLGEAYRGPAEAVIDRLQNLFHVRIETASTTWGLV